GQRPYRSTQRPVARTGGRPKSGPSLREQRLDIPLRIERLEVFELLADADELDGQTELVLDAENGAALGGAVELGADDAAAVRGLLELLGLGDGVLAAGGVEHQQHLVRSAVDLLGDDAVDLLQLAHEVSLGVQPAGGIDDQHVELARLGLVAGVVSDAGGGGALGVLYDVA